MNTVDSFPLTDRPWIMVLDRTGRLHVVSLRQLFADAAQFRALAGDLPTQAFAILRLLLAILHRAVDGPGDERDWRRLWRRPDLPVADINGYLDDYQSRFDLLHPSTPFYQVANLTTANGEITGLDRIIADVPSNVPYLTSRLGEALERVTPAEAARWVVHCQAYDTSGIKSGAVGDPRVKGGKGYPIGTGLCGALGGIFLQGDNLRETLLLNLIPLDTDYLRQDPRDSPVWERPPHGPAEEDAERRGPYGVLNLYTWQSRRIRLFGDHNEITGALVTNGDKLAWDNRVQQEPMTAWRRSKNQEKALKLPLVYLPATHDHTRALWRGLGTLLPTKNSAGRSEGANHVPPALMQWLARLRNAGHLDVNYRVTTQAVGVVYGTQQSVIDEVYHDAVTMNVQVFDPTSDLATTVIDSAADAEAAVHPLRRLAENLCRAGGGTGDKPEDPPRTAAARAAELAFAELDHLFREWLRALDSETDPAMARKTWQQTVRDTLLRLGADLVEHAGPKAWAGRQIDENTYMSSPLADLFFRRALNRALPMAVRQDSGDHQAHQEAFA